jgi:hypothetical protein
LRMIGWIKITFRLRPMHIRDNVSEWILKMTHFGRLISCRYKMTLPVSGRRHLPWFVVTGLPHTCSKQNHTQKWMHGGAQSPQIWSRKHIYVVCHELAHRQACAPVRQQPAGAIHVTAQLFQVAIVQLAHLQQLLDNIVCCCLCTAMHAGHSDLAR